MQRSILLNGGHYLQHIEHNFYRLDCNGNISTVLLIDGKIHKMNIVTGESEGVLPYVVQPVKDKNRHLALARNKKLRKNRRTQRRKQRRKI